MIYIHLWKYKLKIQKGKKCHYDDKFYMHAINTSLDIHIFVHVLAISQIFKNKHKNPNKIFIAVLNSWRKKWGRP